MDLENLLGWIGAVFWILSGFFWFFMINNRKPEIPLDKVLPRRLRFSQRSLNERDENFFNNQKYLTEKGLFFRKLVLLCALGGIATLVIAAILFTVMKHS